MNIKVKQKLLTDVKKLVFIKEKNLDVVLNGLQCYFDLSAFPNTDLTLFSKIHN